MLDHIRDALASYRPRRIKRDGLPRADVLIPIYEEEGVAHVILQVRTELVEHHKGQISFPGGAEDPGATGNFHIRTSPLAIMLPPCAVATRSRATKWKTSPVS